MDSKKVLRKPKHERRDALKLFNYDAQSSFSSFDSSSSVYTCSTDLYDRTSFRIDGIEGEFDQICRSLGLSGPEDFAIPAAAWEAMKFRSSSDILPSLKIEEIDLQQKEEGELSEKCEDRHSDRDNVRVSDEVAETVVVGSGGGINGIRPPMIKPPPGMRVRVVDNTCSTWDLLKELAPVVEWEEGVFNREMAEKENEEVDRVNPKKEEEDVVVDNVAMIAEIVDSLSDFSTSNEDDFSSTAVEPRSNSVSPNGIIKPIITPGYWQKGGLLGRGTFASVYEAFTEGSWKTKCLSTGAGNCTFESFQT